MGNKEYYLGLDIGTNTIGYSVTDSNYNLIRAKGKDFWGVRFFKEAQNCSHRRINRANRRRLMEKKFKATNFA